MKRFIVLCLSAVIASTAMISCKKTEDGKQDAAPEVEVKKNFWVELDVEASKKDDFALYFTEDNSINFTSEQAVWRSTKGGVRETVYIDVDESRIPTDIRLDFGLNKEQEFVTVYNIKVAYQDKSFYIKGSDFFKFFVENKEFKTEVNAEKGFVKILKNGAEYKTPFFYPTQLLLDEIKKITVVKPQ